MECFVANDPIDPGLLGLHNDSFGRGGSVVIRGHVATERFIERTERLFAQFLEDTHADDRTEHAWLRDAAASVRSRDLATHLSLGLRVFRECIPRSALEGLLGPSSAAPRYRLCTLDELRGTHGRVIFSGRAELID